MKDTHMKRYSENGLGFHTRISHARIDTDARGGLALSRDTIVLLLKYLVREKKKFHKVGTR